MTVMNLDKLGEKEFPTGYTVREELESYLPDNPNEDATH